MCIVKKPKKEESYYKCIREESRSQEGDLEKRETVVPSKLQGRLRSISDQKSPRFSIVNKFLFQIRMKYSQNIFISQKYICVTSKERAKRDLSKIFEFMRRHSLAIVCNATNMCPDTKCSSRTCLFLASSQLPHTELW